MPLTRVYEELISKRYLLGSRFHDVLSRLSDMVLRIANASVQEYKQLEINYSSLIEEFNQIATEEFDIENIQLGRFAV